MPNLMRASNQWATRPDDERFWTVREMHDTVTAYREESGTKTVPYQDLSAVVHNGGVALIGKSRNPARLTHWAFGQLAQRADAPASYLRTLPSALAVSCLNQGLAQRTEGDAALLFAQNGDLRIRAMLTGRYTRIWDNEITARLLILEEQGWKVPPARPVAPWPDSGGLAPRQRPATQADLISAGAHGLSIREGDMIGPAGLYASDHDMFAFMVREDRVIDGGNGEMLRRGFFCWNSEVGAASFGVMKFLYDSVCGNHIVWGARDISEVRIKHVGVADQRAASELRVELARYADESPEGDEHRIRLAKAYVLGEDKDKVLDAVFGLRIPALSRKRITEGYELAEMYSGVHGAPNTAWGLSSGLTRLSQSLPYADERVALDRAAGRVLEIAF